MNGDDPQHFARMRREPPPGRPGEPPARPQRPMANPGQSQRPSSHRSPGEGRPVNGDGPRIEPTQVIRRDESGQALAYSQVPPNRAPAPPNRPAADRVPPRGNRVPPPGNRGPGREPAGSPMGYAPTQRPEPFRDEPPRTPPPPLPPGKRRGGGDRPPRGSRPRKKRHWFRWILSLLVVLLLIPVAAAIYVDTHLTRIDALANYQGRVGDTPGTNWLLVGSDSRSGLSKEQEQQLSTGDSSDVEGERTDTVMLVHIPKSGRPTLVSIPRDSYVSIPGVGKDKINASFAAGGAQLLVKTVEGATGLHIDHYMQIGFGGFANMVDAVGGIDMCLDAPMNDPLAGINLPAGCQKLNGPEALGFVRSRATPRADLDRMLNQRKFLNALLKKASSPATLANPFRSWPLVSDLTAALKVDNGAHIWNLASLGNALTDDPITTTVPVGGFEDVAGSGNVLLWDKTKASAFFDALAKDQQVPSDLITTVGS
ncbi:LytR family transcriptional regulator [Nocardia sp. ET3-3]|uniref:LytR family transcriptional regulator n=1 Tax=Nocardia terrae TaxID=2675851 RepID=A0A7K1UZH5_9NOCA|nr:LytR family transcriptional regulator [Nocardia terrae]